MNELNTCKPHFQHFSNSYQTLRGIRHTPDGGPHHKTALKNEYCITLFPVHYLSLLPNYYTLFCPVGFSLFHVHSHTSKCHLLLSLTRRADTYMSQVSLCPLESHIGAEECSKCKSLNLLVCYYGGCQMDVFLSGCHKAPR